MQVGSAGVVKDGKLLFCPVQFNALCLTDLSTGETKVVGHFDEEAKEKLYKKAYLYGDEIWFIPWKAKKIACVDVSSFSIDYYKLEFNQKSSIGENVEKCAYLSSGIYQDRYLYLVPTKYDTPIIIDLTQKTIRSFIGVLNVKNQAYGYGLICHNEFWLTPHTGNKLIRMNIITGIANEFEWKYDSLQYRGLCEWDGKLWFSPGKEVREILFYDLSYKEWGHINLGDNYCGGSSYNECFVVGESLIFLPYESKRILIIERDERGGYRVFSLHCDHQFYGLRRLGTGKKIYLCEEDKNIVYEFTEKKTITELCRISIPSSEKCKIIDCDWNAGEIINEGKYCLNDFIEFVKEY